MSPQLPVVREPSLTEPKAALAAETRPRYVEVANAATWFPRGNLPAPHGFRSNIPRSVRLTEFTRGYEQAAALQNDLQPMECGRVAGVDIRAAMEPTVLPQRPFPLLHQRAIKSAQRPAPMIA